MPGHVLIAGATGVIGRAALRRFAEAGWEITAVSRGDPGQPSLRHLSLDLTDRCACAEAIAKLPPVTHVVYAAVHEEENLVSGWRSEAQMQTNLSMMRNLLDPLSVASKLQHLSFFQGTKAYGVHVRPFPVPARESWPRDDHPNFYWLQEDYVRDLATRSNFTFTIWRPQVVFGDATGVAMNTVPVIGAFAALEAAAGRPFSYPGGPSYVLEAVDTRLIAQALIWAAEAEAARNQTFNITNGDIFTWPNIWPAIADALGAEPGPTHPQQMANTMLPRSGEWRCLAKRLGLVYQELPEVIGQSHHYADFIFATRAKRPPAPALVSTIKLREAGFGNCIDTERMFHDHIQALQNRGILPTPEKLASLRRSK